MSLEENEFAALRAQVAQLRKELDRALDRLDLPNSRFPDYEGTEYPRMEFEQVSVRTERMHVPAILHSDPEESGLYLYDDQHRLRGCFAIGTDGLARLEIYNADHKLVLRLGEGGDGRGEARVNDVDGTTRAGMKVSAAGGAVSVVTAEGKTLAALASGPEGGKVFVCTPQPLPAVALEASAEGGVLAVYTPQHKPAVLLKAMADGGRLILSEPSGQAMGNFSVTATGAALSVYGELGSPAITLSGLGELGGQLVFFTREGEIASVLPLDAAKPPDEPET